MKRLWLPIEIIDCITDPCAYVGLETSYETVYE